MARNEHDRQSVKAQRGGANVVPQGQDPTILHTMLLRVCLSWSRTLPPTQRTSCAPPLNRQRNRLPPTRTCSLTVVLQ